MNCTILAASIVALAATWHIAATMMICVALRKRGLKVSFIFLRLLAPKYASQRVSKRATRTFVIPSNWRVTARSLTVPALLGVPALHRFFMNTPD